MAKRKTQNMAHDNTVSLVRGIILYLCLISLFGCVILIVQASMQEKKVRYTLTRKSDEKKLLLDEIRKVENRIAELESYERIASLMDEHLPHLAPAQYPAIVIPVPGLVPDMELGQWSPKYRNDSWVSRLRDRWRKTERSMQTWLDKQLNGSDDPKG